MSTLDLSLFDIEIDTPTTRPIALSTGRHSLGCTDSHDPALRGLSLAALFVPHQSAGQQSAPLADEFPAKLSRYQSLPTLLYSETDDVSERVSPAKSPNEIKRKSLNELIDEEHPLSPSKDADDEPTSPKRFRPRRSLPKDSSPIERPSLIEKETARLAVATALAGDEDDHGSDTETISGELEELAKYTSPSGSPPSSKSYAPRASLVQLTARNFEQQLLDERAAAQAYEAQQAYLQQQQAFEAAAAQQQQQLFAMQQMQQQQMQQQQMQQFYAPQQQPPQPFGFAPPAPYMAPMAPMMMPPQPVAPLAPLAGPFQFTPIYPSPGSAHGSSPSHSPPPMPPMRMPAQQQYSPARSHHVASPRSAAAQQTSPRGGAPALKLGPHDNLLELAKDKKGSRQLQDGLPKMSDTQLVRACDELGPHLLELAKHPSANYVVSRLATLPHAHAYMVRALTGHVADLLVHPQGSRVVQAAVAELPLATAETLVGELRGKVLECALDTHGSWGVCAAYKRTHEAFILDAVVAHIEPLATQQHGCRVVQRVLAEAAASGAGVAAAAAKLLQCDVARLALDAFGNYAVQVTMRHAPAAEREALVAALLPRLLELANSKHGSNVAETLLTLASPAQLEAASALILSERATLRELMGHPFGNYVLQALLRLLAPDKRAVALRTIEVDAAETAFGRTIVTHFAPERA